MKYQLPTIVEKIKFAREGAAVHRVHAQPGLHPYQVGMHSFNMLTMLRILKPDASLNLVWAVVKHDIPERVTCDVSHPAKAAGILNREAQMRWEKLLNEQAFGEHTEEMLTPIERMWLAGLDMLEFYCWCKDQIMMGNRMMETKKLAVERYMIKYAGKYPEVIVDAYHAIKMHHWHTMPDIGEE